MRFLNQDVLYILFLILLLLLIFLVGSRLAKNRLARLGGRQIERMAELAVVGSRRRLRIALTIAGMALLILALARPQYGSELVKIKSTGSEVMIALDVSMSMLAGDYYPNRLEKAKRQIITLLENLPGERVGLIVFSGQAFVQCPLTIDHAAVRMFLDVASVGTISDTGTDIEKAIDKAAESFSAEGQADRALVIFTDGETQGGDPIGAARRFKHRIFTVGVGTPKGEPIPVRRPDGTIAEYKKDENGETVVSKLNEELLVEIAAVTGGAAFRATPGEQELNFLIKKIKGLKKGETEGNFRRLYEEKFQYFLMPGIVFIGLAMFIGERKKYEI